MSRELYALPDDLEPDGDICVPIFVPNSYGYLSILHQHMRKLTLDRYYERDENNSALIVREQWQNRTYIPLIDALIDGSPCDSSDSSLGSCFRMRTETEAFSFYPNDPFISDGSNDNVTVFGMTWRRWENTDIENSPVFQAIEDIVSSLTGYYPNDCILFPSQILSFVFGNWLDVIDYFTLETFPFPYVHIELEGSGQFEIELVNIPFGGSALLVPDTDITSWQDILETIIEFIDLDGELPESWIFTEVDRDISIPPETAPTQTQEIEFAEEGQHSVTIVFIPRLDDEIPFLFPFGGIREIEICGNLKVIGSQTGTEITKENAGLNSIIREGVIPLATSDEFYDALVRWTNERANRWLLGFDPDNILNDVQVDKSSGQISIAGKTVSGNDPISGSNQETHFGGVYRQAEMFKQLFDEVNSQVGTFSTATIVNLTRLFINPTDLGAWTTLVTDYVTADPQIAIDADILALHIYCLGYQNGVLSYALAEHGSDEDDVNSLIDFTADIPSTTWQSWYDEGILTPRIGYEQSDCYRFDSFQMTFNPSSWNWGFTDTPLQIATGKKWRVEIAVNEVLTNGSGHTFDGIWRVSGGAPTDVDRLRLISGGSTQNAMLSIPPKQTYPALYVVEFNVAGTLTDTFFNNTTFGAPVSGEMVLTFYDLGKL